MNKNTVKQFAETHAINYRENGDKIVLVYDDGLTEEYLFFDADGNFCGNDNGDLDTVLSNFLTTNQQRRRIISAFNQRASELRAEVFGCSVETASGIGCHAPIDHHLNKKLATENERTILRELLANTYLESYATDDTIARLLESKPSEKPLPVKETLAEPSLQNSLQDLLEQAQTGVSNLHASGELADTIKQDFDAEIQKALTDINGLNDELKKIFDADFSEEAHRKQMAFEELFDQFCQNLPQQTLAENDFPDVECYADFDRWALDKIMVFRQSPKLGDIDCYGRFQPSDWHMSIDDMMRAVDRDLDKNERYWGNYGYLKLQYNRATPEERQEALAWAKYWLYDYGFDFDCYYEILSFFIKELPELAEYFEDFDSVREAVYAWRGGVHQAEYYIRECVLSDYRDEEEKTADYFDIDYFPETLTAEEIKRLFTAEELTMFHRFSLAEIAKLDNEDNFKYNHEKYIILALKMDWYDVIEAVKQNPFLTDLLWQSTRDKAEMFAYIDSIGELFSAYLQKINHKKKDDFTKQAAQTLRTAKTCFTTLGLYSEQILLWTLAPPYHDFIRPYFAYMIDKKLQNPNIKLVIDDDMALAIGWSRLRREPMQDLVY